MNELMAMSCIRLILRTKEPDFLSIVPGPGCSAKVGKTGGPQVVNLEIPGCMNQGTIQHEILHTLGFIHEQNRSDRDDYVDIQFQNIIPGKEDNFFKEPNSNNLSFPYDFTSVMHYERKTFSSNNLDTIIPKPDPKMTIGQTYGVSALDIAKLNKLYNCSLCRIMVSGFNGIVTSGNYPSAYPDNTNCQYMVRVPESLVLIEFKALDLQASPDCGADYLRIYDGPSTRAPLLLDKACGSGQLPPLISSSNAVLMEFVSDDAGAGMGFKASFTQVTCGAIYSKNNTMVTSPNYPARYSNSADCVYIITAPSGYKVSLKFSSFLLQLAPNCGSAADYLVVHDGSSLNSPILGKFCSSPAIPPAQVSSGKSLLLHFVSDAFVNYPGYAATYTFVPNNGQN